MSDPERGFLLHLFHRQQSGRPDLFGVGRLESGPTFAFADSRLLPSLYLRESELPGARPFCLGAGAELDAGTGLTTMDGEPVVRVGLRQPRQLRRLAEGLHGHKLRTYEADVSFPRQWLVARGVRGPLRIGGSWRPGHGVDRVYVDPEVEPGDWEPDLRLLALDIETTPDAGRLLACSLVAWGGGGEEVEEIHLAGEPAAGDPAEVRCHATEADLLTGLLARVRELDPDVLTGWNLVDFDLTVLQTLCRTHGVPFNLGRSTDESWYQEGDVWGGSRVVVYGRQVLDAMHLVRATLQRFEDNRLHTVALALLGRGKTFEAGEGDSMPDRILAAFRDDRAAFAGYCLEDSRLVRDILLRQDLVRLSLRRACLTGLPLERAWGSVAAFDFLYLTGLRQRGMVAPTTGVDRVNQEGSPGGLVMASRAGLYRHVFVFDFKSLYPSIIRTFNIDPLTHLEARGSSPGAAEGGSQDGPGVTGELLRAPNGALFTRRPGILPEMLAGFFDERARARAAGDELAAFTCKIVMNSFYGVLASGSCRFAEGALAGAITGFGHYLLRWTRALLEDERPRDRALRRHRLPLRRPPPARGPHRRLGPRAGPRPVRLAQRAAGRPRARSFDLPSYLDLEFEKYYARFFLPPMRGDAERGRAKGYAGLKTAADGSEELEIIGMEAVRRDWTDLAHEVQRDLLERVFHDAPAAELEERVLVWVDAVRRGERDDDLVYRKALRKSVDGYTRTVPAHVAAARLLPEPRGTIRYLVTRDGPQPAGRLSAPIDYEHYIEKQIRPIVRTIGQVCDLDVEVALGGTPDLFRNAGGKP